MPCTLDGAFMLLTCEYRKPDLHFCVGPGVSGAPIAHSHALAACSIIKPTTLAYLWVGKKVGALLQVQQDEAWVGKEAERHLRMG